VGTRDFAVRIKINDKLRLPCSRAFAHGAGGIPLELARARPGPSFPAAANDAISTAIIEGGAYI
jgi:hypothetical protein